MRLSAIASALEGLARELRRLELDDDKECGESVVSSPTDGNAEARGCASRFAVGRKVRVVIKGAYCGREGRIVGRRGTQFWNVALIADGGRPEQVIYKRESSLELVAVDE